jgi:integrase
MDFSEILITLRHSTMRPGELRMLRWEYIQWDNNRIVFPPQVIKTRKRREVTLIDRVKKCLRARKARLEQARGKASGYVFPATGTDASGKRAAVDVERPMKQHTFSQRFGRLFKRCVGLGLVVVRLRSQGLLATLAEADEIA